MDQLHLPLGLPARHRYHGAAQQLGAIVGPKPASKQAVTVSHLNHVAAPTSGCAYRAGHQLRPGVDVVLRVTHHGGLARGARGRMQTHHLLTRHRKQTKRVVVAQVFFDREGKARQVAERLQVGRVNPLLVKRPPVMGHMVIGTLQRGAQAL